MILALPGSILDATFKHPVWRGTVSPLALSAYLTAPFWHGSAPVAPDTLPASIRTVALCAIDDDVLRPIAERFGVEVVVDDLAATPGAGDPSPPATDSRMTAWSGSA